MWDGTDRRSPARDQRLPGSGVKTIIALGREDTPRGRPLAEPSRPRSSRWASWTFSIAVTAALGLLGLGLLGWVPRWALVAGELATGLTAGLSLAEIRFTRERARLSRELEDARKLGNWRLEELLGRGGMGEVWRASHVVLPRPAAVKFIRPEALGAADPDAARDLARRFRREARIVASLTSPHTIEIYDFGLSPDGALCYVMEYLEGMDLETLVRRYGPLPPNRVVHLLRQVCISLAEAHQAGLVHRDLKPANLYVCRKGVQHDFVKVLDFGMAVDSKARTDHDATEDSGGTPSYIAPEIVEGKGCDTRSDIYSLGCVAFFLLTGRTVFPGSTAAERMAHHVSSRPDAPSRHSPHPVPRDLDLVVLACLAKKPGDRPITAAELSRRLAACDAGPVWTAGAAMKWWTSPRDGASSADARPRSMIGKSFPA